MIDFRRRAEMFVAYPRTQLAHYVDSTMPRRDWSSYDLPLAARKFLAPRYRKTVRTFRQAG